VLDARTLEVLEVGDEATAPSDADEVRVNEARICCDVIVDINALRGVVVHEALRRDLCSLRIANQMRMDTACPLRDVVDARAPLGLVVANEA
jgi:hypothetical protein